MSPLHDHDKYDVHVQLEDDSNLRSPDQQEHAVEVQDSMSRQLYVVDVLPPQYVELSSQLFDLDDPVILVMCAFEFDYSDLHFVFDLAKHKLTNEMEGKI